MNPKSPENRRAVYLQIDTINKGRLVGPQTAKRAELYYLLDLPEQDIDQAISWLKRNELAAQEDKGWHTIGIPPDQICWLHGRLLPCQKCKRSIYKEPKRGENKSQGASEKSGD